MTLSRFIDAFCKRSGWKWSDAYSRGIILRRVDIIPSGGRGKSAKSISHKTAAIFLLSLVTPKAIRCDKPTAALMKATCTPPDEGVEVPSGTLISLLAKLLEDQTNYDKPVLPGIEDGGEIIGIECDRIENSVTFKTARANKKTKKIEITPYTFQSKKTKKTKEERPDTIKEVLVFTPEIFRLVGEMVTEP